jgi:hypothetical protein
MVLSILVYGWSCHRTKGWAMKSDIALALVTNAMTLVTIATFLLNIMVVIVVNYQFTDHNYSPQDGTLPSFSIDGNEQIVFFTFSYAFLMVARAMFHSVNGHITSATTSP